MPPASHDTLSVHGHPGVQLLLDEAVIESLPATALKKLLLEFRDEDEDPQRLAHHSHSSHNQWAPSF